MKKRTFMMMAASMLLVAMGSASCGSKDGGGDDVNPPINGGDKILIANPTTVNFGWSNPASATVTITTDAEGGFTIGATENWYTAEKSGSKVVITAETNSTGAKRSHTLKISATDAADASIIINQSPEGVTHASLQGSAYYVWAIDAISYELIKDKIVEDFGPNNIEKTIHIWSAGETLIGVDAIGPNFYETTTGGWMAFEVGTAGWSGGAYDWNYGGTRKVDWSAIEADGGSGWYLHAAIRGSKGFGHRLRLLSRNEPSGQETTSYSIQYDSYDTKEDAWTEVEVHMEDVFNKGWEGCLEGYTMSFHGSGTAGKKLEWDALFIYKK